jgi:hypothetical protein
MSNNDAEAFSHRNYGSTFVVLGYNSTYFSNKIQKGKTCYSEEQVILRDVNTICRRSWYIVAHIWKIYDFKIEVIPLSYLQNLVKDKKIHEARAFNFTYRYIDDVISIKVSEYKLFKRSNKANLFIALVQ